MTKKYRLFDNKSHIIDSDNSSLWEKLGSLTQKGRDLAKTTNYEQNVPAENSRKQGITAVL
ncbi:MAG: hypothetical protein RR540_03045 [Oscillospiraceae bacterium]